MRKIPASCFEIPSSVKTFNIWAKVTPGASKALQLARARPTSFASVKSSKYEELLRTASAQSGTDIRPSSVICTSRVSVTVTGAGDRGNVGTTWVGVVLRTSIDRASEGRLDLPHATTKSNEPATATALVYLTPHVNPDQEGTHAERG